MPRWKPDAQQRLQSAALELFAEKGYDGTTIAEIADRAGLEKRSFFRHFPDKREVLFSGGAALQDYLGRSLELQPSSASPWDAVIDALRRSGDLVAVDRELSRLRRGVIDQNAELREREVLKSAQLEAFLLDSLLGRGVELPGARVIARLASLVYERAFDAWLDSRTGETFVACVASAERELTRALPSVLPTTR